MNLVLNTDMFASSYLDYNLSILELFMISINFDKSKFRLSI